MAGSVLLTDVVVEPGTRGPWTRKDCPVGEFAFALRPRVEWPLDGDNT